MYVKINIERWVVRLVGGEWISENEIELANESAKMKVTLDTAIQGAFLIAKFYGWVEKVSNTDTQRRLVQLRFHSCSEKFNTVHCIVFYW